ncbi:HpcH/HpaI aldolase/citrate lyase family protein [Breoghania sp. L-A4]|uniref:HpcH/HpaI aldolase family protein n=1 Tax=Breoghania sp. L-A4 TaxID=2304600 RepID=UPI000E35CB3B|nr:HpcH/HpaI aldolase/citrate lyase family protein [Breoghania sp. L-A4]AXS42596.1 4-hydroxy-2-oxo-heptane-1,7-dioate aldolase [Breoghania sp. L-A4]
MLPLENAFKKQLLAGETLIGLWSILCSPISAESLSDAGFDWMLFDTEHSPVDLADVYPLLQAAASGSASAVVRPAWNDKVLIKRALDIGAQTLLIPYVQSVDEARAAVAATRYPPTGIRGVAGNTRASRYGRAREYFSVADAQVCVLVQIETGEAMKALPEIAAVDGVDGVFIGPADLAASMGHLGNPGHEDVQSALRYAVEQLKGLGKPAGILATTVPDAQRYRDWGYQFVAAGVDLGLLNAAADGLAKAMRLG